MGLAGLEMINQRYETSSEEERTQKIIRKLDHDFSGGATLDRTIGYFAYMFGDMDGFFGAMSRAVEEHVFDPFRMRYSPIFENVRRDSRYRELMRKYGVDPVLKEPSPSLSFLRTCALRIGRPFLPVSLY